MECTASASFPPPGTRAHCRATALQMPLWSCASHDVAVMTCQQQLMASFFQIDTCRSLQALTPICFCVLGRSCSRSHLQYSNQLSTSKREHLFCALPACRARFIAARSLLSLLLLRDEPVSGQCELPGGEQDSAGVWHQRSGSVRSHLRHQSHRCSKGKSTACKLNGRCSRPRRHGELNSS